MFHMKYKKIKQKMDKKWYFGLSFQAKDNQNIDAAMHNFSLLLTKKVEVFNALYYYYIDLFPATWPEAKEKPVLIE